MTTVYPQAIDEMFARFKIDWDSGSAAIAGYIPEVRWQGKTEGTSPPKDKFWARVSYNGVFEEQSTLSNCVGEPGKKHYEAGGFLYVQLFSPKSLPTAAYKGRQLAVLARNAFRGKVTAGGVWFRRVRIEDMPEEESFLVKRVVAEPEYDELG